MNLFKKNNPNFSTLFLNAGAHIQHHYFFNSKALEPKLAHSNPDWYIDKNDDPFLEMLDIYNTILEDILNQKNVECIVATGLSQKPYDQVKYYYRLKDHDSFISKLGIKYKHIYPRMTRDFLIEFDSNEEAQKTQTILSNIEVNNEIPLFGEIDNRGLSLFVTLTYPDEICHDTFINSNSTSIKLFDEVVFVAIKNGMHQSRGFSFYTEGLKDLIPQNNAHVKEIHKTISNFLT